MHVIHHNKRFGTFPELSFSNLNEENQKYGNQAINYWNFREQWRSCFSMVSTGSCDVKSRYRNVYQLETEREFSFHSWRANALYRPDLFNIDTKSSSSYYSNHDLYDKYVVLRSDITLRVRPLSGPIEAKLLYSLDSFSISSVADLDRMKGVSQTDWLSIDDTGFLHAKMDLGVSYGLPFAYISDDSFHGIESKGQKDPINNFYYLLCVRGTGAHKISVECEIISFVRFYRPKSGLRKL